MDRERESVCVCVCRLRKSWRRKKRLLCGACVEYNKLAENLPTEADMMACISYRVDELLILNIDMYIRMPSNGIYCFGG